MLRAPSTPAGRPRARTNLGATSLRRRRRARDPMRDFDALPPGLRRWLASAVLPWAPRSVGRAFDRALARTRDEARALAELDRVERRLVARDAACIWGREHPMAAEGEEP